MKQYKDVIALLLYWEPSVSCNLGEQAILIDAAASEVQIAEPNTLKRDVDQLEHLLERELGYRVHPHAISPSPEADPILEKVLEWFVGLYDSPDNLLVVYYGGHADNTWGLHVLPSVSIPSLGPTLQVDVPLLTGNRETKKSNHPQLMIDFRRHTRRLTRFSNADLLVLMDCCYAGGILKDGSNYRVHPSSGGPLRVSKSGLGGAESVTDHTVRYIMACSQTAPTPSGNHYKSFTSAFVQGCRSLVAESEGDPTAALGIDKIMSHVQQVAFENAIHDLISEREGKSDIHLPILKRPGVASSSLLPPTCRAAEVLRELDRWLLETLPQVDPSRRYRDDIPMAVELVRLEESLDKRVDMNADAKAEPDCKDIVLREVMGIFRARPRLPAPGDQIALQALGAYCDGVLRGVSDLTERLQEKLALRILLSGSWDRIATPATLKELLPAWTTNVFQQAEAKALIEGPDMPFLADLQLRDTNREVGIEESFSKMALDASRISEESRVPSKADTIWSHQYIQCEMGGDEEPQDALVEIVKLESSSDVGLRHETHGRVRKVTSILHRLDTDQFRLLPCRGYVIDREQRHFGIVFDLGPRSQMRRDRSFWSLRDLLVPPSQEKDARAGLQAAPRQLRPSLENRKRAALVLVRAVAKLHMLGLFHKSIRSSNVCLTADSATGEPDFAKPWLLGYSFSREEADRSWKWPNEGFAHDVYCHYDRWSLTPPVFTRLHDIYSLVSTPSQFNKTPFWNKRLTRLV
ncbi:hypothetical protein B0T25DRAFT_605595 [Lasiosphaeria hispida]|uniref:Protein kinase domain-containing protein n=1 Tax=Lasiosphaeria hispida TaxID=260671 RepID=A0AAJ0HNF2_9PEZI|nr:hypothetical protein B0T25DRAFT_605595 [Lasiosphaeria hispida]